MTKKITLAAAKKFCQARGLTFRHTDGEYRVAYAPRPSFDNEPSAYYTCDLEDALNTAQFMGHLPEEGPWGPTNFRTGPLGA